MPYPVSLTVQPLLTDRNRLTTAFRAILAIPHIILVGAGVGGGAASQSGDGRVSLGGEGGLLGAVAGFLAIVSWFTIVFTGNHIDGIRQFTMFYLRWRARAFSYLWLFEDQYPPFGDAPYPTALDVVDPIGPRNRVTVGFRIILAIPHFLLLFFVLFAWFLTTVVAWFAILFTGSYPKGLYDFGVGAFRWRMRVEAYMLLLVDEYPPFSFD
jgi:hypothetical protein